MSGAIDDLKAGLAPETCSVLVDHETHAWARARDLVVGIVRTWPDDADFAIRSTYDALDASAALRDDELWNVVLVVVLRGEVATASSHLDRINRDLSRSRKIALVQGDPFPPFFTTVTGENPADGSTEARADPLRAALDKAASGELRLALDVLFRVKRPSGDVDTLIDQLSKNGMP